jgi:ATP-binding cassette subfamily B protein
LEFSKEKIMHQSIVTLLKRLWHRLTPRRRRQFGLLLALMMLTSFAEIVSIGAVLPFLEVLTAPERIFELPAVDPIKRILNLNTSNQLVLPIAVAFGLSALIAGAMRLLLLWANNRYAFGIGAELSIDIYRRTLYQSYKVHCARNSSEVINGITVKANIVINGIIIPTITLISSIILLISILIPLLLLQPIISLIAFGGFGLIYLAIIQISRNQLMVNSKCEARESTQVIKCLQEGLGGIRDVLLDGSQETYCQIYRKADSSLRRAQASTLFISSSPRYAMEALGMLLISALAYSIAQHSDGLTNTIPLLGALALCAQRLLPVLQQAYTSWTRIKSSHTSLSDTLNLLDQPLPDYERRPVEKLPFNQNITLKNLAFTYNIQEPNILEKVNITIAKGSRVGFIGETGSGKSTLIDIVMGLLEPTTGSLEIDGQIITLANIRAWQDHIAHVPQAIFLADTTIEENIAFGVPREEIDHSRVIKSAQQAQISSTIESWSNNYRTLVGERGIRLSGGQRQRIGIARALYKQADVIIFDEATSALDSETEQAVMQAIESLSEELTLLIVAHRLTTLKNCTQIVQLGDRGIKCVGNYQENISI